MTLWLEITKDRFELPVYVADTAEELARFSGCDKNTVYSCISNAKRFGRRTKFVKVEIEEDDSE